ncbi:MAG: four helix bundle protein [Bacteroidales bacterium]|nr:four helix bundle protein [Paludibacteraceae bacterium]MCI6419811.1 four helix bundle protein [Bacteroidales bacterium]MDD5990160.1 four helix bundle protein [Paludibacteraceae bacterium]
MNNEDPKIYNLGILEEKTYAFALRIIKAYNFLTSKNEYVLSKQLLRAGTSIGANCREATYAQSKMDFINKLSIALKEANETIYWLELLHDSDFIDDKSFNSIHDDGLEILKLLISIIKTSKENLQKQK